MGKQLSIYLDEQETKRLAEIAQRECRRPVDQVRYLLRNALGIADEQPATSTVDAKSSTGIVLADSHAAL